MNEIEEEIFSLEEKLLRQEIRSSIEELDKLLSDDFREFGSDGKIYSKKNILEKLPKENFIRWEISDFAVIELASDCVLATYRAEKIFLQTGERKFSNRSSIWKKITGRWQMVFHQGTGCDIQS